MNDMTKNKALMPLIALFSLGLFFLALIMHPLPVKAQDDSTAFDYWVVFESDTELGKRCTMFSKPLKEEGNYTRRGDVWMFISHYPAANIYFQSALTMGYPIRNNSMVSVSIDGKTNVEFTTDGETAHYWGQPSKQEIIGLMRAMKRGNGLVVKGRSTRGTLTTDSYSLVGFTAALREINRLCGTGDWPTP